MYESYLRLASFNWYRFTRFWQTLNLKSRLYPLQLASLDHHHIKAASRQLTPTAEVTLRGKDDALAFAVPNAGQGTAVSRIAATAYFYKNQGALRVTHNQVNFAAAAPRCAVIALQQLQAVVLQKGQCFVLCCIAYAFGAAQLAWWLDLKGAH
jgi:hypothetical protein